MENQKQKMIPLDQDTAREIKHAVADMGITETEFIRLAIAEKLDKIK